MKKTHFGQCLTRSVYFYVKSQLIDLIRKDESAAQSLGCVSLPLAMHGAGDDEIKLTREQCMLGIPESFEGSQRDMKG